MTSGEPKPARPHVARRFPALHAEWQRLRRRMVAGLLLVLPFLVTFWIVYWLYTLVNDYAIRPVAQLLVMLVQGRTNGEMPGWFVNYTAPLIGIIVVLGLLYFLGFFARARAERILDAILLQLPIVTSIHKAVRQLFAAVSGGGDLKRFDRTVLVEFPHPGMRVPGFVTATCRDVATNKTILCVYVPTTPVPTSGYMLLIPEENVTNLDWPLEQTIQAVVSFGITAPADVQYYRAQPAGAAPTKETAP
jgi:uncharacterized membrane protein